MSYGYGQGRANPYDQRGGAPTQQYSQPAYGGQQSSQYGQQYNAPAMGRDEYGGQNVEMEPLTQNGSQFGRQGGDPNQILNECREIDRGVEDLERALEHLEQVQKQSLNSTTSQSSDLEDVSSKTMSMYRNLAGQVKRIKQKPESGSPKNAAQVRRIDEKVKRMINKYQQLDKTYRDALQEQAVRQYRIVRPDVSEADARELVETSNNQIFAQAMLQSDRRGQATSTLSAVKDRHAAIQKIERDFIELAQLMQDMDNLVVQQEAAVANVEMKGEEVVENLDKGTEQIGTAIKSARNTRKWKWWCLGICVLIVIVIVVVVLIYKFVIQTPVTTTKSAKRFVLTDFVPAIRLPTSGHRVLSGNTWTPSDKIVVPGQDWVEGARKMRRFQA